MFVAVLLYKDVLDRPQGIPDSWPAEVRQLGNSRDLPGSHWILMRCKDLPEYQARFQGAYDLWKKTRMIQEADGGGEE